MKLEYRYFHGETANPFSAPEADSFKRWCWNHERQLAENEDRVVSNYNRLLENGSTLPPYFGTHKVQAGNIPVAVMLSALFSGMSPYEDFYEKYYGSAASQS